MDSRMGEKEQEGMKILPIILLAALLGLGAWALSQMSDDAASVNTAGTSPTVQQGTDSIAQ